jgi:hypothetical protein
VKFAGDNKVQSIVECPREVNNRQHMGVDCGVVAGGLRHTTKGLQFCGGLGRQPHE